MTMKDKQEAKSQLPTSRHRLPWWVSILMAIGSYCTLKFIIPDLQLTNPAWQKLAQAAPTFAPLVTIPFLLLAAKQLYDVSGDEEDKQDNDPNDYQDKNSGK